MKSLFPTSLEKALPPNVDREQVRTTAAVCLFIATLVCLIDFMIRYSTARQLLYTRTPDWKPILIEGARIQPYGAMIGTTVTLFAILTAAALASASLMAASFYQGGRSIYLMRRLPDGGKTLRKYVWTAPLRLALLCAAWCVALLVIYYLIWRFATPAQCLGPAFGRLRTR